MAVKTREKAIKNMMAYYDIFLIIALTMFVVGWKIIRRIQDKKKIHRHIKNIGGEIFHITKLSFRKHIYVVQYHLKDELLSKTVKYDWFSYGSWF